MPKRTFKGCPFCCSLQIDSKEVEDLHGHHWLGACLDCECEGPLADTKEAAVALWNNRPCEP